MESIFQSLIFSQPIQIYYMVLHVCDVIHYLVGLFIIYDEYKMEIKFLFKWEYIFFIM
jgi:hypothetical protein